LGAQITVTSEPYKSTVTQDAKVDSYLVGIMWGLSGKGKLLKYSDASGSMGHGFFHVAHTAIDARLGAGTFWAKGKPWTLSKGITGKTWSDTLSPSERKIMSLLTKAMQHLDVKESWSTYFRAKDSFLGSEIKKALPHQRIGIITRAESEYLGSKFIAEIGEYNKLLRDLERPQIDNLKDLSTRIKRVGQTIAPLSMLVDTVVSHRTNFIYSKEKKIKKTQLKTPISDLVNSMDWDLYVAAFDPLLWAGAKPYRVPEDFDPQTTPIGDLERITKGYKARIDALPASFSHLKGLANTFSAETFGTGTA
jgi:hypothetical protein